MSGEQDEEIRIHSAAVWVFHRGALGDSVLLWPRLRQWVRSGSGVVLVADGAKARLAEQEIEVEGLDAEQHRFNQLWREGGEVRAEKGVSLVVDCAGGGSLVFAANLTRMFPGAIIQTGSPARGGVDAVFWMIEHPLSEVELRRNEDGPVVVHVGAGSESKRWQIARWEQLNSRLSDGLKHEVVVLAGEVEQERFAEDEHIAFKRMGGRFVHDLLELADLIRGARLFIGCDSGPTHLAAQLGVRTLALFGPTDASVWAPVGPAVRPVWPEQERPMDWLDVDTVIREAGVLLTVIDTEDDIGGGTDGSRMPG